jgi:hypothetical protein
MNAQSALISGLAVFGGFVILGMFVDFKGVPLVGTFDYFE